MRTTTLATALIFLISQATAQNSCNTAQVITPGTYTVLGVDGPEAPSPLCIQTGNASNAEWYSFTPLLDTAVVLTTDLPGSGDTRFHVFSGNCGALVCVAGDDDSGSGLTSTANFDVEGGVTYRIAFDNKWSSAGFSFRLTEVAPIVVPEGLVIFTSTSIPGLQGGDCVVDMNGDHLDDVVSASSTNIRIAHQQSGGGFISTNIPTTPADHTPSWSIAAGDIDGNGFNDLLYGGGQGATFMMANDGGTAFTEVSFSEYIFSQRTNMVDINNDGNLDAFVCHDVAPNVSFMNDGTGNLTFGQGGFGTTCGNYGSVWIDYDNDGLMDCFVAKCGCDPVDLLMHNNGDGTFTNMAPALGFADNHQSWSSAWGDFDNDGDMDVMVGGSSSGYNKLISNNGDGTFTNVTPGSGFDTFSGQSIEWTTHDFNNDGFLDVLGGGAIMYGNGAMVFAQGPSYPGSGAIGDLNNDGFLDVMAWNSAMINGGNDYNWLKVNTIGTVSNTNGIGARVTLTSALGTQSRDVKSGDAFSTMSSLTTHFGLGADNVIEELRIQWPSGIVTVLNDVPVNTTVNVTEELSTAIMETAERKELRVYPNPTEDRLFFELPARNGVRLLSIFDMTGKCVMQPVEVLNVVDVADLAGGMYLLRVQQDGEVFQSTFTRQ